LILKPELIKNTKIDIMRAIVADYESGYKIFDIMRKFNISPVIIYRYLAFFNVPIRVKPSKCGIVGCTIKYFGMGYCQKHYSKAYHKIDKYKENKRKSDHEYYIKNRTKICKLVKKYRNDNIKYIKIRSNTYREKHKHRKSWYDQIYENLNEILQSHKK